MKQKLINNILYVFDVTPYEITADGDEADVIEVQQECYEGFIALNPDLASKIVKYNYHMFTVSQLEWAPYVDEPDPKVSPALAWSANTATVTINADDNVYPTLTNPNSVTVAYTSSDSEVATINAVTGAITLVAEGTTDITAAFAGNDTYEADSVTYELTVEAAQPEPEPELPESGTMYDFTGYATEDASEPASSGTITYEGEWEEDTSYVYGYADVTFVGSDDVQSITVYMTKDDLLTALDGGRAPVYTMQSDQLVPLGYGELSEYSGGDTECTVTLTGTGASDTYINVEVGGSLITDFTDYIDQETGDVLFTLNADEEIKIYPLDNQENYSVTSDDAGINVDDADQYYWYATIGNDATITIDYTDANPQ